MKKSFITLLVIVILAVLSLTGCQNPMKGSGDITTEVYDFSGFSRVEVDGPLVVAVTYGDEYEVEITADDNVFKEIEVSVDDATLVVKLNRSSWMGIVRTQFVDTTVEAVIRMPYIQSLSLDGAAEGAISGFNTRASMAFSLVGSSVLDLQSLALGDTAIDASDASSITGEIVSGDVIIDISGASIVELGGSASCISCNVRGASKLELYEFAVDNAKVNLRGASEGFISPSGKLDVDLSGASDLCYRGNPVMGKTKISEDSRLIRE